MPFCLLICAAINLEVVSRNSEGGEFLTATKLPNLGFKQEFQSEGGFFLSFFFVGGRKIPSYELRRVKQKHN